MINGEIKLKEYIIQKRDELKSKAIEKLKTGEDMDDMIEFCCLQILDDIQDICENRGRY